MNFRRGQRHCAPHISHLNPGNSAWFDSPQHIAARFSFRDYAYCALLDYLWDKLVRVKQSTAHGDEQTAGTGATRIVADVGYHSVLNAR